MSHVILNLSHTEEKGRYCLLSAEKQAANETAASLGDGRRAVCLLNLAGWLVDSNCLWHFPAAGAVGASVLWQSATFKGQRLMHSSTQTQRFSRRRPSSSRLWWARQTARRWPHTNTKGRNTHTVDTHTHAHTHTRTRREREREERERISLYSLNEDVWPSVFSCPAFRKWSFLESGQGYNKVIMTNYKIVAH